MTSESAREPITDAQLMDDLAAIDRERDKAKRAGKRLSANELLERRMTAIREFERRLLAL